MNRFASLVVIHLLLIGSYSSNIFTHPITASASFASPYAVNAYITPSLLLTLSSSISISALLSTTITSSSSFGVSFASAGKGDNGGNGNNNGGGSGVDNRSPAEIACNAFNNQEAGCIAAGCSFFGNTKNQKDRNEGCHTKGYCDFTKESSCLLNKRCRWARYYSDAYGWTQQCLPFEQDSPTYSLKTPINDCMYYDDDEANCIKFSGCGYDKSTDECNRLDLVKRASFEYLDGCFNNYATRACLKSEEQPFNSADMELIDGIWYFIDRVQVYQLAFAYTRSVDDDGNTIFEGGAPSVDQYRVEIFYSHDANKNRGYGLEFKLDFSNPTTPFVDNQALSYEIVGGERKQCATKRVSALRINPIAKIQSILFNDPKSIIPFLWESDFSGKMATSDYTVPSVLSAQEQLKNKGTKLLSTVNEEGPIFLMRKLTTDLVAIYPGQWTKEFMTQAACEPYTLLGDKLLLNVNPRKNLELQNVDSGGYTDTTEVQDSCFGACLLLGDKDQKRKCVSLCASGTGISECCTGGDRQSCMASCFLILDPAQKTFCISQCSKCVEGCTGSVANTTDVPTLFSTPNPTALPSTDSSPSSGNEGDNQPGNTRRRAATVEEDTENEIEIERRNLRLLPNGRWMSGTDFVKLYQKTFNSQTNDMIKQLKTKFNCNPKGTLPTNIKYVIDTANQAISVLSKTTLKSTLDPMEKIFAKAYNTIVDSKSIMSNVDGLDSELSGIADGFKLFHHTNVDAETRTVVQKVFNTLDKLLKDPIMKSKRNFSKSYLDGINENLAVVLNEVEEYRRLVSLAIGNLQNYVINPLLASYCDTTTQQLFADASPRNAVIAGIFEYFSIANEIGERSKALAEIANQIDQKLQPYPPLRVQGIAQGISSLTSWAGTSSVQVSYAVSNALATPIKYKIPWFCAKAKSACPDVPCGVQTCQKRTLCGVKCTAKTCTTQTCNFNYPCSVDKCNKCKQSAVWSDCNRNVQYNVYDVMSALLDSNTAQKAAVNSASFDAISPVLDAVPDTKWDLPSSPSLEDLPYIDGVATTLVSEDTKTAMSNFEGYVDSGLPSSFDCSYQNFKNSNNDPRPLWNCGPFDQVQAALGVYPKTPRPTKSPTQQPTQEPTREPTPPTQSPTSAPTTKEPTKRPTLSPSKTPTKNPTASPTKTPTKNPTASPTKTPTKNPTGSPTKSPTKNPTANPTLAPTTPGPTKNPTRTPTLAPTTINPTRAPTTGRPTTVAPSKAPTRTPTTGAPTGNPTPSAAIVPTRNPTQPVPTRAPTTGTPTRAPTTGRPTTTAPTRNPTQPVPTRAPTTGTPTRAPTTSRPTTTSPSRAPTTGTPTRAPTTGRPTTTSPSRAPTTGTPTRAPTTAAPVAG